MSSRWYGFGDGGIDTGRTVQLVRILPLAFLRCSRRGQVILVPTLDQRWD